MLTISETLRTEFDHVDLKLGTTRSKNFAVSGQYISDDGKTKMLIRVSSIAEDSTYLQVEVVYKDSFRVIAQ